MSFFKQPASSWHLAGNVKADFNAPNTLITGSGTGVLVNLPDNKTKGADLFSNLVHGDADLELDYMMARGSNSGIYLQGNYEIQLADNWGNAHEGFDDNGGIYQRWDEKRGKGNEGFEGYAPRQVVSRAPGLWQHLKILFQAPRFDAAGKKTENAKLLRVELNGVVIHENVELSGPTRGALSAEKKTGPLRFQGDHGAVAFRNIRFTDYSKVKPVLGNLNYVVYKGLFEKEPDYAKLHAEFQGRTPALSSNFTHLPDTFLIRYTGTIKITEAGDYNFNLLPGGGQGSLNVNNQVVVPFVRRGRPAKITLPSGDLPFELLYSKFLDWAQPSIGLTISGPGIREYRISDANSVAPEPVDPILIEATKNTILRSFIDIPGRRIVHAVSVGSPAGLHYTYDMDNGAIAQVWRCNFLDATPMWHERGDGSSRATGSVVLLERPVLNVASLSSPSTVWPADTIRTGFRPKGYVLDSEDQPVFRYNIYGANVRDSIRVMANRQGLTRQITIQNVVKDVYVHLAGAKTIEDLGNGLYALDDKSYYLKIEDGGGAKPVIRDANNQKELIIPVRNKIRYTILF